MLWKIGTNSTPLLKYNVSIAVLTETETSHSFAESTNIEGFKSFCPPSCVTGPSGNDDITQADLRC